MPRPKKFNSNGEKKKNFPIRMYPSTKEALIKTHREYMQKINIDADQDTMMQLGIKLINKHVLKDA